MAEGHDHLSGWIGTKKSSQGLLSVRTVQNSCEVFKLRRANSYLSLRNVKNEVPILSWKRHQNVLVSFPNLSWWEQIFSLWSRIWSGTYRNDLFRWGRFGNELRHYGFIPVRCRNFCGTYVERLWNVCGACIPLLFWHYNFYSVDGCLFKSIIYLSQRKTKNVPEWQRSENPVRMCL